VILHETRSNGRRVVIGIVSALTGTFLVLASIHTCAQTLVNVPLAWNPSAAPDIAGYYLYQGSQSGNYTNRVTVSNTTNATLSGLAPGLTYYFAVSAFDTNGLESALSTEISYTPTALNATYYGISLNDPAQALADSDGDGLTNLVEYALGANPFNSTDANAGIHTFITQASGNAYLVMQYRWRTNAVALQLQYLPEVSADKLTWYSDSTHVLGLSVAPLDSQFSLITVRDTTPITSAASRFIRLRVVLGSLQSTSPMCIGTDTLLRGNDLTIFSQRMVRPILCAGTVAGISSSALTDTNAAFVAGEFGTNGMPAYVEFNDGTTVDISQTTTNTIGLAAGPGQTASVGDAYRIQAQFTIASLFGTNDEAGLASGPNAAKADNVLLYLGKTQSTLTLFYYSNPTVTAWQGWVRADNMAPDASEVIEPEAGVMVRRIPPTDLHLYDCGPIKTGPTRVQVQPGYNLFGTLNSSTGLTLSNLNLYTGNPATGVIAGLNSSTSDNLIAVEADGSVVTFFYYYRPGVFQGWLNASGYTVSDNVVIPSGSAFFINRQSLTGFTWTIPAF